MKEGNKAHQHFVDGKYAQWESLVAILYDWLANHNHVWPSPLLKEPAEKKPRAEKKVVIQENTDESMVSIAEKTGSLLVSDGLESSFTSLKKKKHVETSLLDEDCELRVRELEKKSNK
ncbi:hypothetical protein NC651_003792 [Populus alba x Populus x berolinensis]|nr:hypothetical protein NC651_003792 [Populus alba x Populus x berolinensis]